MRADVLLLSGEPVWPPHTGGRARLAGLAAALAEEFRVGVLEVGGPDEDGTPWRRGIAADRLPGWRQPLSPRPRLGRSVLGPRAVAAVRGAVGESGARALVAGHSYLGAMVDVPRLVVDFANVEAERYALLARSAPPVWRAVHTLEAAKARRWEPALARRAWLNVAVSDADAATIRGWGGDVVTVPSGRPDWIRPVPSPAGGPALLVVNATYAPNVTAARWLLDDVWPHVRHPRAALRVVGRGSDAIAASDPRVTVAGEVADLGAEYAGSAFVVAPVGSGGGTQLKVAEALAAGRAVVATSYSARSVPGALGGACVVADEPAAFARAIDSLFEDRAGQERVALATGLPSWAEVAAPLVERLRGVA
ncbi:MAG TPA: glycosyltransferase family 4 protein [Mycobacteriales bacterium]